MPPLRPVLETWFRRVWNEEDTQAIDELFIPDGLAQGFGPTALVGPEQFKPFHQAVCALLSDIDITIEKSGESDDWISVVCTLRANSEKTGKAITITGSVFARIVDGVLREAYNHWDSMSLYEQLALLPLHAFMTGLQGKRIA